MSKTGERRGISDCRGGTMLPLVAAVWTLFANPLLSQQAASPRPVNPAAIARGRQFFVDNCGICHGQAAQGTDKGPALNHGQFARGGTDDELFNTITRGIPGTTMPPSNFPADQVWTIIAFLRSTVVAARASISGNPEAGEKLFWIAHQCGNCHMVKGKGGVLGQDLTRIGGARTVAYLTEKLREPDRQLTRGSREPNADYVVPISNSKVTVVTKKGERITGVPKNEDNFSIQVLGADNQVHVFLKSDLNEVLHEHKSLMPAYTKEMLNERDLNDLLAYLAKLR